MEVSTIVREKIVPTISIGSSKGLKLVRILYLLINPALEKEGSLRRRKKVDWLGMGDDFGGVWSGRIWIGLSRSWKLPFRANIDTQIFIKTCLVRLENVCCSTPFVWRFGFGTFYILSFEINVRAHHRIFLYTRDWKSRCLGNCFLPVAMYGVWQGLLDPRKHYVVWSDGGESCFSDEFWQPFFLPQSVLAKGSEKDVDLVDCGREIIRLRCDW